MQYESKVMTIDLRKETEEKIQKQIKDGTFKSAEEVVDAGVSLLDSGIMDVVENIRREIDKGDASELIEDFDPEAFLKDLNEKYQSRSND